MPKDDPLALVGTTLDGRYTVDAFVASGGFGLVYRARHLGLRTQVAVKVFRPNGRLTEDESREMREAFAREAQLVAQLDHPAVVRVRDFGSLRAHTGDVLPWMVTDWVDGVTLDTDLAQRRGRGGRSRAECLRVLKPVFEALIYAHGLGIAHRDIKPANMMFTLATRDSGPEASSVPLLKLLDFGIAKEMSPEEEASDGFTSTRSTRIAYSPKYGAPEQFGSARTGPWTDIHAMALVLTEMLTDQAPYLGTTLAEVTLAAPRPERPSPRRHGVDVGPWEPVLARALALRPSDRFASMREFLAALEGSTSASWIPPSGSLPLDDRRVRPDTLAAPHDSAPSDTAPATSVQAVQPSLSARRTAVFALAGMLTGGLAVLFVLATRPPVAASRAAPRAHVAPALDASSATNVTPPRPVAALVFTDAGAPAQGETATSAASPTDTTPRREPPMRVRVRSPHHDRTPHGTGPVIDPSQLPPPP